LLLRLHAIENRADIGPLASWDGIALCNRLYQTFSRFSHVFRKEFRVLKCYFPACLLPLDIVLCEFGMEIQDFFAQKRLRSGLNQGELAPVEKVDCLATLTWRDSGLEWYGSLLESFFYVTEDKSRIASMRFPRLNCSPIQSSWRLIYCLFAGLFSTDCGFSSSVLWKNWAGLG
jgi:hypothetical protein